MRYWLYSEGNILGPYTVEELASQPTFSPMSLVCPEISNGTNPSDWKTATEIKEISELVKVGVIADSSYFDSDNYISKQNDFISDVNQEVLEPSYSDLLDTIDNILKNYKDKKEEVKFQNQEFDAIDKFDIRLAKIQEELEAARWEKNVLLERLRLKEEEEKKDKNRIAELEKKLKDLIKKLEADEKVIYIEKNKDEEKKDLFEKIQKIKEINESSIEKEVEEGKDVKNNSEKVVEDLNKKTEEKIINKEEKKLLDDNIKVKKLESFKKEFDIKSKVKEETKEVDENFTFGSGKLKSFGYEKPKRLFEEEKVEEKNKEELKEESLKPLPSQESGIVYDFTFVTPKIEVGNVEKIKFKIEPKEDSFKPKDISPSPIPSIEQTIPSPDLKDIKKPDIILPQMGERILQSSPVEKINDENRKKDGTSILKEQKLVAEPNFKMPTPDISTNKSELKTSIIQVKEKQIETKNESDKKEVPLNEEKDKTLRVPLPAVKSEKKEEVERKIPKKSKLKFILTLLVFGIIAVFGIFYFFSGNTGVQDIALVNARVNNKQIPENKISEGVNIPNKEEKEVKNVQNEQQPSTNTTSKISENVKKSIEIVKNYNLSDGRGTISNWFSNNFSSSKQVNDEWSSTLLQDNIYVVQYRVIRPKQEPLVYQFEVDVEKGNINRGINNNAIELLESNKKEVVKKQTPPKTTKKQVAMAKSKKKEVSLLPLPEKEDNENMNEPTGFENADTITTGKVKINAPETDEELF